MTASFEEVTKVYASLFQQWVNLAQPFISPDRMGMMTADPEFATNSATLSRVLLQAISVASTSSLSYAYSLQSITYKFQASLIELNLPGEEASQKRAMLIDELRGYLREIGDCASREGRNFQHQLARITEELAQAEAKDKHEKSTTTL